MDKHDHSQDTIDVKHLLHNAEDEDIFSIVEDLKTDAPISASNPSGKGSNSEQPTQAIPRNYTPEMSKPAHAPGAYLPHKEDILTPEKLDAEQIEAQDDTDRKKKIWIISICAGVLTLLLTLIGVIIFIASGDGNDESGASNVIADNVYVAGIDLSGKSAEQAKNLLHLKTDHTFTQEHMVVKLPGSSINLSPVKTGAKLDVDAVVEAALKVDSASVISENGNYNIALLPYLTLDLTYIRDTIDTFCETYSSVLTQPVVVLDGTRPQFDAENPDKQVTHQVLRITLGTPEYVLDAEDLYTQVLDAYSMNQLTLAYAAPDLVEPETVDVSALYEQYCTPPQDAVMDVATYEITPEIYGYGFQPTQLQSLLDSAYYGETVEITFQYLTPSVLSSDFSKNMFIDTLAQYQISSNIDDSKRNNNLSLSCAAINNYVVNAGDTFSFNKAIGKITTTNGYATAAISELNGSVMGGGISQTASALYACALIADLDIVERHNHEYAVDFCELGLDAVTDGSELDLRFRNNTSAPIRILAEAKDGRVHIEIQGTNERDYEIELLPKIVAKIEPLTSYQNMAADNPAGYVDGDILQKGITGYKVTLHIDKYSLETGERLSTEEATHSEYAKVDEVVVRISPEPTVPTIPEDTSDPTENTDNTDPTIHEDPTDPTSISDVTE